MTCCIDRLTFPCYQLKLSEKLTKVVSKFLIIPAVKFKFQILIFELNFRLNSPFSSPHRPRLHNFRTHQKVFFRRENQNFQPWAVASRCAINPKLRLTTTRSRHGIQISASLLPVPSEVSEKIIFIFMSKIQNIGISNVLIFLNFPEMMVTEEEMISAKLTAEERDFCAHKLIEYKQCRHDVWPWVYKCHPEKHAYMHCEYEE